VPSHAVGLQPERQRELVRRHRLVVVGAVEPGGAVERAAGPLHELEVLVGLDVRGALEEHVLEQVREAGASLALVRRADVVPQVHRDDRRGVILREHDQQAVGEAVAFDGNLHRPLI
jgi:hypothetical protein